MFGVCWRQRLSWLRRDWLLNQLLGRQLLSLLLWRKLLMGSQHLPMLRGRQRLPTLLGRYLLARLLGRHLLARLVGRELLNGLGWQCLTQLRHKRLHLQWTMAGLGQWLLRGQEGPGGCNASRCQRVV